jgi:prevent-host-death family protein
MQIGELKAHFSEVIERVKRGEEIVISYGRRRERVAVLVPYERYHESNRIRLGDLEGTVSVEFADDFKIGPEELIGE